MDYLENCLAETQILSTVVIIGVSNWNLSVPLQLSQYARAEALLDLTSLISDRTLQAFIVDCANGVGAAKLEQLKSEIDGDSGLALDLRNTGEGPLNGRCGADFVQKGEAGAPCLPSSFQGLHSSSRWVL